MIRALVLRIPLRLEEADPGALAYLTDALGECARELEDDQNRVRSERGHFPSGDLGPLLGLIADPDDPGRYAWEIVAESYPGIGE